MKTYTSFLSIRFLAIYGIYLIVLLSGCERDQFERNFPRAITKEVTDIRNNSGAVFNGEVTIFGTGSISEHGFVWGDNSKPVLGKSETVKLGSRSESGKISAEISTTLLPEIRYFVRSYIISEGIVVYGNEVEFVSLGSKGPIVTYIEPANANMGDTILVVGSNFSSFTEKNIVKFSNSQAVLTYSSTDTLKAIVPTLLEGQNLNINVSILGNKSNDNPYFSLNPPLINSINPLSVSHDDYVTIKGNNFIKDSTTIFLDLFTFIPETGLVQNNSIRFKFPRGVPAGMLPVKIQVFSQSTIAKDSIYNDAPEILDFNPKQGNVFDTIVINGSKFGSYIDVRVEGFSAKIVGTSSVNKITVIVPLQVNSMKSIINLTTNYGGKYFFLASSDSFQLYKPFITSISHTTAVSESLITIYGNNFTPLSTVFFGSVQANLASVNKDSIEVYVPELEINEVDVIVNSAGYSVLSPTQFEAELPTLISVSHSSVEVGDTISVSGVFSSNLLSNQLFIDNNPVTEIIEGSNQSIKFKVPMPDFNFTIHSIKLTVGQHNSSLNDILIIKPPEILTVYPRSIGFMDNLTITGYFPVDDISKLEILAGTTRLNVVSVTKTEISLLSNILLQQGVYDITVIIDGIEYFLSDRIAVPWKKTDNLSPRIPFYGFVISDRLFGGFVSSDWQGYRLYEFDPATLIWTRKADIPEARYIIPAFDGFSIAGKGYIGFNSKDNSDDVYNKRFWQYDPILDTWTEKSPYPLRFEAGYSMEINGRAFVGTGIIKDTTEVVSSQSYLWEYDYIMDKWITKAPNPVSLRDSQITFAIENDGYVVGGQDEVGSRFTDVWAYDMITDSWNKRSDYPGSSVKGAVAFSMNKIGYVGTGRYSMGMWSYNYQDDSWARSAKPASFVKDSQFDTFSAFMVLTTSMKAFYFSAEGSPYTSTDYQIWEFDPSFLQE